MPGVRTMGSQGGIAIAVTVFSGGGEDSRLPNDPHLG